MEEEDTNAASESQEDDPSNDSTLMNSREIAPSNTKVLPSNGKPQPNIDALYEQLSNLKPLKSHIPVKESISKPNLMTTSMIITPSTTEYLNSENKNSEKSPNQKVRFSEWETHEHMAEVRTISSSSSSSSCGSSSGYNSDNYVTNQVANNNNSNKNTASNLRSSGLKKSGEFFNDLVKTGNTKAVSSMVIPRRSMNVGAVNSPNTHKRASLSVTDL